MNNTVILNTLATGRLEEVRYNRNLFNGDKLTVTEEVNCYLIYLVHNTGVGLDTPYRTTIVGWELTRDRAIDLAVKLGMEFDKEAKEAENNKNK